jgi:hypothetical protein
MIGEYFPDDALGLYRVLRIVFERANEHHHGLPERPATATRPGRPVRRQPVPEHPPALAGQERPRDVRIAGGISHCGAAEVDDGAQPAIADQQVFRADVPVQPYRRTVRGRAEGRFPDLGGADSVNLTTEGRDRGPGLGVVHRQRAAAKEIVLARRRTASGIDLVQGGEKVSQAGGELARIRDPAGGRVVAVEPPVDRPLSREPVRRRSLGQRLGDGEGKLAGQRRQPPVLLVNLQGVLAGTGQPHRHVLAEPEGGVVPPVVLHRPDRKISPLRKLVGDQPGHERWRDGCLVHGRHHLPVATGQHTHFCLAPGAVA